MGFLGRGSEKLIAMYRTASCRAFTRDAPFIIDSPPTSGVGSFQSVVNVARNLKICGETHARSLKIIMSKGNRNSSSGGSRRESSLSRKGSLGQRLMRKLSKKNNAEDVMDDAAVEESAAPSSVTLGTVDEKAKPQHLVILVNGIAGSALNWKYAAEQFKLKLGDKVIVHCSSSNSFWKTFSGVDIMGARLANEVMEVVKQNPGVTKISFIGHSLGGLISRHAVGLLYAPPGERSYWQERTEAEKEAEGSGRAESITYEKDTVAGLEPINFITLATPHLGCRDNQNLPFLFGLVPLEKIAPLVSHLFIGRTGKHLFLADGRKPLLELMVTDCSEGRFLSALRSFKQRTAYANVGYDHMVGWRTASIRKEGEMPEVLTEAVDPKYPHIVLEETVLAREGNGSAPTDAPAKDLKEEIMVTGLQQLPWWRVDVNFSKAKPYYAAHNLIQVKVESQHGDGEDVIRHVIDKHFLDSQSISE